MNELPFPWPCGKPRSAVGRERDTARFDRGHHDGREVLPATRRIVAKQNDELLDRWHELSRRVQDQVWVHPRHYLHSIVGVSWLFDRSAPDSSALLSLSWGKSLVSLTVKDTVGTLSPESLTAEIVDRLLDRLRAAIGELGYEAIVDDLRSPDLLGGDDSLLPSQQIMVVPGHMADTFKPVLLAVTRGWNGKAPLSFEKVMRQVKTCLIEAKGSVRQVIVVCDSWDSASFEEVHRDELGAHSRNGVQFEFVLVGVPDRILVALPVAFDLAPR